MALPNRAASTLFNLAGLLLAASAAHAQNPEEAPKSEDAPPPAEGPQAEVPAPETPNPTGSPAAAEAAEGAAETEAAESTAEVEQSPANEPAQPQAAPVPAEPAPAPAPQQKTPPPPKAPEIFEPPLPGPTSELDSIPPPPAAPTGRSPNAALWAGARVGWLFPAGNLWQDTVSENGFCCTFADRSFDDFASPGPLFELNLGARIARRYNVFAFWEYTSLGTGDTLDNEFGGQLRGTSHFVGAGLRLSTNPDTVGLFVELALGYRYFAAEWESGTELTAEDFLNTRLGVGADIRINEQLSLSPLLSIGGSIFTDPEWKFADGSRKDAIGPLSDARQHTLVSLQLGAHFDLFGSKD